MVGRQCDEFLHLRFKQKLVDIKEQSLGQMWQNSNNIEHCQLCSTIFSVAKRKVCV